MSRRRSQTIQDEAKQLGLTWGEVFGRHFAAAYKQAVLLTHPDGCPYPGAAAVTFAVARACSDTYEEALYFSAENVEEWLKRARQRQQEVVPEGEPPL